MKRVLKDLSTGLFFKNMDEWTSSIGEAASFRDTLAALKFCEQSNLTGVAVMLFNKEGMPARVLGFRRNSTPYQSRHQADAKLALSADEGPMD